MADEFRRRVRFSDLQREVRERGVTEMPYLPLLGEDGFFVRGWSHILAAYPKTGKTEITIAAIRQWVDDEVLYFTEEPEGVWEMRAHLLPDGELSNLEVIFAMGMERQDILNIMMESPATIFVIDTIRDVLRPRDENDNAVVAETLRPFITATRQAKKTLILLHHTNKIGGEGGRGIAGAHAFLGTVDVALELEPGPESNQRIVRGRGRIMPIEPVMFGRDHQGNFKTIGVVREPTKESTGDALLMVLDGSWRSQKELEEMISSMFGSSPPSETTVKRALETLITQGHALTFPEHPRERQRILYRLADAELVGWREKNGLPPLQEPLNLE